VKEPESSTIQIYDWSEISNETLYLSGHCAAFTGERRTVRNHYFQMKREFEARACLLRYIIETFQFWTKVLACLYLRIKIFEIKVLEEE
jgi:hypothetical protein